MTNSKIKQADPLWDAVYIIGNLPSWVYTEHKPPQSLAECRATLAALENTIKDIDLQVEIRGIETETSLDANAQANYLKWKVQALRAKQTHMYLHSAYTYWLTLNDPNKNKESDTSSCVELQAKFKKLVELLAADPADIYNQLDKLSKEI
jgi:hypothetical protein